MHACILERTGSGVRSANRKKEGYQTLADRVCKLYTRLGVWLCGLERCGVVGRQKGEGDDVDPYVI
jgi:hypothetical protein